MQQIQLKDIRIFTNHGCLTEEEKIGSEYLVNLTVEANLSKASQTDELRDTVDYVHLNKIVTSQMAIRSKLLEHVAQRILDTIFKELPLVTEASIGVAKVNPPIGGDVAEVIVCLSQQRA